MTNGNKQVDVQLHLTEGMNCGHPAIRQICSDLKADPAVIVDIVVYEASKPNAVSIRPDELTAIILFGRPMAVAERDGEGNINVAKFVTAIREAISDARNLEIVPNLAGTQSPPMPIRIEQPVLAHA